MLMQMFGAHPFGIHLLYPAMVRSRRRGIPVQLFDIMSKIHVDLHILAACFDAFICVLLRRQGAP